MGNLQTPLKYELISVKVFSLYNIQLDWIMDIACLYSRENQSRVEYTNNALLTAESYGEIILNNNIE